MMFLRFNSESAARAAFAGQFNDGDEWPSYIGLAAVDVIGVIYRPTGNLLADDAPEMTRLEGFHINLSDSVPELQAFEIEQPSAPARVFFGAF